MNKIEELRAAFEAIEMTKYFGRDGIACQRHEWMRLRADHAYRNVRQYDNGQVNVGVEWLGAVDDPNIFKDYYKLFELKVFNYNDVGKLVADPVDHGRTFATEAEAIEAYKDFLVRWTESNLENGELVEEGNVLTPPPPPNPDAPASDISTIKGLQIDECGAW